LETDLVLPNARNGPDTEIASRVRLPLMPYNRRHEGGSNERKSKHNRHRWKNSIESSQALQILEDATGDLKWAWDRDTAHPESYPMNSAYAVAELVERLRGEPPRKVHLRLPPSPPKRLFDLISEQTVKAVYEDQNADNYEDALRQARASGDRRAAV